MSRYIVAVSGGVDSVCLLDMLVAESQHELIVAHFDHGIRPESDADARFVEGLAKKYGLVCETRREELGERASEELARERRYLFLRELAEKYDATIATAHHRDDAVETIAINLYRGTGWRGLAVFGGTEIYRPLMAKTKADMRHYALAHNLEWVEDETNAEDRYLRNRIRRRLAGLTHAPKDELLKLWKDQLALKDAIDIEVTQLLGGTNSNSRHFFTQIDETVASELLRCLLLAHRVSLTGPQRHRLLHAIRVAKPGTVFQAGSGASISFTSTTFIVETPVEMVLL